MDDHFLTLDRMGKLERMLSPLLPFEPQALTPSIDGYLPLHALRRSAPEARHTYLQGQVIEHGYLEHRAG